MLPTTKTLATAAARPFALRPPLLLLLQLLLLSMATTQSAASPVSSPEIVSTSVKAQQPQQSNSQQQQQQQQQQMKHYKYSGGQDALNSLSAFATNYDSLAPALTATTTTGSGVSGQGSHFKPSYKIPEMETNFQPIQSITATGLGASPLSPSLLTDGSPVLMQYLPHTVNEGGMQYLQLIPTHPLMVPIGPYLHTGAASPQATMPSYQHLSADNSITAEFGQRPMLTSVPANNALPAPSAIVEMPPQMSAYGVVPQYATANSLQPFRNNYRINREIKPRQLPDGLTLNMNEYLPGPHDMPQPTYSRGRP